MIRLADIAVLATTKLRSHRIRTSITIGVSGILFGLLMATVFIMQGVFTSVERFSNEGLNNRYLMTVSYYDDKSFNIYDHRSNPKVVKRVEQAHAQLVAKKQAAAEKYDVSYNSVVEDPSPVVIDQETKEKIIDDTALNSTAVEKVVNEFAHEENTPFDIDTFLKQYPSAKVLSTGEYLTPVNGQLTYMEDNKEPILNDQQKRMSRAGLLSDSSDRGLMILPQTVVSPFVTTSFDAIKGELPVVFPYSDAEKLLNLKPLKQDASSREKRDRIREVHRRVGEITVSFCYRNIASSMLVDQALLQEETANKQNQSPSVVYRSPASSSCGSTELVSDTRTEAEKQADQSMLNYQKAIGEYQGKPEQQKLILRGVGISGDGGSSSSQSSIAALAQNLLSSSLGYGAWIIPEGLLSDVPNSQKPAAVFAQDSDRGAMVTGFIVPTTYLVEFGDKDEALDLLHKTQATDTGVYASPFGSASLILAELRMWAEKILFWAIIIVGTVAAIILSGLIGRTIADSRRETAVFRAIGASRSMIATVYLAYTILFSCRVIIFALVLGIVIAGIAHLWLYEEATIGAQLVFGAVDQVKTFGFIDVRSWYLLAIIGSILVVGLLAMILPLLRNIGRNPIRDMRDE